GSLEYLACECVDENTAGFPQSKQEHAAKFRIGRDRHLESARPDSVAILISVTERFVELRCATIRLTVPLPDFLAERTRKLAHLVFERGVPVGKGPGLLGKRRDLLFDSR